MSSSMSHLLAFYRGDSPDTEGRTLDEILAWGDDDLEEVHDFIQWLFPLVEPSQYNPTAPLFNEQDIAAFRCDPLLKANLTRSFERILTFLGFVVAEGKVVEGQTSGTASRTFGQRQTTIGFASRES